MDAPKRGISVRHKGKTQHRAETQRRREKQNQNFVALSCEKPFYTCANNDFGVVSGEAGNIDGFLSVSVSLRENIAFTA